MKANRGIQILYLAVFLLSVLFRLNLSILNRESNDNHMTVIDFILLNEKLPKKDNCWECFQPKLFHYTVASVITHLGLGKATDSPNQRTLIAQLINFIAGVITLVVILIFIKQLPVQNERLKFFAFALVALNPPLIGISAQATNDAFVILFSTLALYFAASFLQRQRISILLLLIIFAVLAVSSKTNGWVAVVCIFIAMLIKTWKQAEQRGKSLTFAFIFLLTVVVLATVNPLTQYIVNYQKYGSPVLINMERPALPFVFEKTWIPDGGILSVQDGFFTFHLISLLVHPQIDYGNWNFTPQRTSFWTQLYAKAYSIHFDNFPPSWANSQDYVFMVSRGILILALLPTILLLAGLVMEGTGFVKRLFQKTGTGMQTEDFGLFIVTSIGYLTFIVLYAFVYRDFTVIKAIFVFPALLSFIVLFLKAGQKFYSFSLGQKRGIASIFDVGMISFLVFSILDLMILVIQLQQHRSIF